MRAIEPSKKTTYKPQNFDSCKSFRLFVGGIPKKVTRKELMDYFQAFGPIKMLNLATDELNTDCNRGYCFITFRNSIDARKVLVETKNHVIRSKVVGLQA